MDEPGTHDAGAEFLVEGTGGTVVTDSVHLKRIKGGYTWSIFVNAADRGEAGLLAAVEVAAVVDERLRDSFPTEDVLEATPTPRPRRGKTSYPPRPR